MQTYLSGGSASASLGSNFVSAGFVQSTSGTLKLGNWTITADGTSSNALVFSYNGTDVAKLETDGELIVEDNITAFGSV